MVRLTPNCLRLRLNAALCAQNCKCAVQHSQRTFNFNCKVNVTRSVNDVDTVVLPVAGRGG